jgi:AraC-like DNA-binding protein/quercetin dioxygenase-like cupin family protein
MSPMTIVDTPILALSDRRRSTGDGVHLLATRYPKGTRLEPHAHREAQLVYAAAGTMQVTTPKGRWLVPPDRAVWVPAHLPHAIDVLADIEMRSLYFNPERLARDANPELGSEFVVRVSRLLHEAILALFDGRNDSIRIDLLIRLALLELQQAGDPATFMPLPQEPRCRRAAEIVLADPTRHFEIETLAQMVGTSTRTLSRLFSAETQLSFKSWCQRARIAAAIERLSVHDSGSLKQLASELGYASFPAFSHAFRQVTGKTPTEFAAAK